MKDPEYDEDSDIPSPDHESERPNMPLNNDGTTLADVEDREAL